MNIRMPRVPCISVNCPEQANPETEQMRLVQGAGGRGKRMLATITRFLFFLVRSEFIQIQREACSTEWAIAEGKGLQDFSLW